MSKLLRISLYLVVEERADSSDINTLLSIGYCSVLLSLPQGGSDRLCHSIVASLCPSNKLLKISYSLSLNHNLINGYQKLQVLTS